MKNEKGVNPTARLAGIATAVPAFKLDQTNIGARAAQILSGVDKAALSKMLPIYENAGIKKFDIPVFQQIGSKSLIAGRRKIAFISNMRSPCWNR